MGLQMDREKMPLSIGEFWSWIWGAGTVVLAWVAWSCEGPESIVDLLYLPTVTLAGMFLGASIASIAISWRKAQDKNE